ncbi:Gfo/Idh/MocA family oxidoreductase [Streptomyces sp. SID14478]|uniref:Gfo/Idh/MocA family oxidoreductase n=1 Tax=Streptomyces sp. SID14478 TaxID=2706073 RepID=UPI0013D97A45|nr:Gfo/Idh/MocA family oxidoreductase [Streptomyces sp. SID14478]
MRYGLIGPGEHAQENLLPALSGLQGARLEAVAARRLSSARAAARRWGVPAFTDNWTDLVDSDQIDALIVAGSPHLNADVTARALSRGLSVFTEKPPAPDAPALDKLIALEASAPAGTVAFVGFNFPYGQPYRQLRTTLRPHGELRSLDLRMVSAKPTTTAWHCSTVLESLLQGLGTHAVDLAIRELGPPDAVHAHTARIDDVRIAVRITMSYADGRLATLLLGNYSNRLECRWELVTDTAVVGVLDQLSTLTLSRPAGTPGAGLLDRKEVLRHDWPSRRGGYGRTGYSSELESFHHSVLNGAPSTSPLSACRDVYRVLDEVLRQVDNPLGEAS